MSEVCVRWVSIGVLVGGCMVCGVSSRCHVRWYIYIYIYIHIYIYNQELGMIRYIYIYIAIYTSYRA